jgi:hypothetical protein
METVAIRKIKSPSLLQTETITAKAQISNLFVLFSCLSFEKSLAHAKNTGFEEKKSLSPENSLDFYIETSTRTWV